MSVGSHDRLRHSNERGTTVKRSSFSVASFVLGICALISAVLLIGGLAGIAAVILGSIALKRHDHRKGQAVAGIVMGSLSIIISLLVAFFFVVTVPALQKTVRDTTRQNQINYAVNDISKWQAENDGTLPDPMKLSESYRTSSFTISSSGKPTTKNAVYIVGTDCDGRSNSGAFHLSIVLESGKLYCQGS